MKENKTKLILILVIVALVIFIVSWILVRPAIINHNNKMRQQGIEYAVVSIMQQVATCQPVPLTFENTTINVVAVDCLQGLE